MPQPAWMTPHAKEQTHHSDKATAGLCRLSDIPAPPHKRHIPENSLPYKEFPSEDSVEPEHGTAIA